ncbi:hypothetical protein [Pantoea agglomerans]|uniref:hypothetical protein n=1 Tax=Enterobacter agglomerans TaxID=549 RepID=UPI003C7DF629
MNNLKERIAKAFGKYDVVVVSGSQGVGKTTLLKDFVKENGVWVCVADITYMALKHKVKGNSLVAIDDVKGSELKTLIKKVQEIIAKTNNKPKILIATDYFDKDSIDSAVLKVKHFRLRKEREGSKKGHSDIITHTFLNALLKYSKEKPYIDNVKFLYSFDDIETEQPKTKCFDKTSEDIEEELEQAYAKLDITGYEIQELHSLLSRQEEEIKGLSNEICNKAWDINNSKYMINQLEDKLAQAYEENEAIKLSYEKAVSSLREEIEVLTMNKQQLIKGNNYLGNIIRNMKLS